MHKGTEYRGRVVVFIDTQGYGVWGAGTFWSKWAKLIRHVDLEGGKGNIYFYQSLFGIGVC